MALASPVLRGTRFGSVAGPIAQSPAVLPRPQMAGAHSSYPSCPQQLSSWTALGRAAQQRRNVVMTDSQTTTTIVTASELDVGYSSVQGVRDTMEDEVQVHYNTAGHYLYAAIFDGHGGDHAARWLANQLHSQVESCLVGRTLSNHNNGKSSNGNGDGNGASNGNGAGRGKSGTGSSRRPGTLSSRDIQPARLVESFHLADRELLAHLAAAGGEDAAQSGSTATVVVIKDDKLVVANVGDSQAVLSRRGNAVPLAHYHRVYGSGPDVTAEIERVKSVGGWVDDGRVCGVLAVSRAFGDWEFKGSGLPRLLETGIERGYWDTDFAAQQRFSSDPVVATPDVTETLLTEEDEFLIVASDGLWDVLPPREAVQWARKEFRAKKDASEVAASLAGLALRRYSTDNVAVVVVDLQGADQRTAKHKAARQQQPRKGGMFERFFLRG